MLLLVQLDQFCFVYCCPEHLTRSLRNGSTDPSWLMKASGETVEPILLTIINEGFFSVKRNAILTETGSCVSLHTKKTFSGSIQNKPCYTFLYFQYPVQRQGSSKGPKKKRIFLTQLRFRARSLNRDSLSDPKE